jgi:hypothetical protein
MVVAQKWTGTNADRDDMHKLKLDQVVRVSCLNMSHARLQTNIRSLAQFWPAGHIRFRLDVDLHVGSYPCVCFPLRSTSLLRFD